MSWYLKPHDKIMRSVPKPAPQRQFLEHSAFLAQLGKVYVSTSNNNWPSSTNDSPLKDVCYVCVYIYMNSKWEYLLKYCFHTMNNDITTIDVCKEVEAYPVKRFCHALSVGNNSSCFLGGSYRTAFTENDNFFSDSRKSFFIASTSMFRKNHWTSCTLW